ncbi:MAG: hypothetical protein SCM11_18260, partial [Bacillota bacterium]|nr:hypothetical protein [Bacillota bacterium]
GPTTSLTPAATAGPTASLTGTTDPGTTDTIDPSKNQDEELTKTGEIRTIMMIILPIFVFAGSLIWFRLQLSDRAKQDEKAVRR